MALASTVALGGAPHLSVDSLKKWMGNAVGAHSPCLGGAESNLLCDIAPRGFLATLAVPPSHWKFLVTICGYGGLFSSCFAPICLSQDGNRDILRSFLLTSRCRHGAPRVCLAR